MPGPDRPNPDTAHIETRLLVVAEMLERAVAEVHRAMSEIRAGSASPPDITVAVVSPPPALLPRPPATPQTEVRSKDDNQ